MNKLIANRLSLSLCFLFGLLVSSSGLYGQVPLPVVAGEQVGFSEFEAAIGRFEAKLASDVAEDGIGSIAAGVFVGDKVVWAQGFGWADVDKQVPAEADTIYRIGSISKSFTAVLMAQMAERGKFKLDDAVAQYFPAIEGLIEKSEGAEAITFRHLASHTAGLIREPRLRGAASGPISGWEDKILASIPTTAYQSLPGERYSYSNIGFGMLGLAVSRAAGKGFMELVTEEIFKPLGMESSFFVLTEEHRAKLSMGYTGRGDRISGESPAREHAGRGYKVPNGGIYSTVGDLAKFGAAMCGASKVNVFSAETRKEILTQQTPEGGGRYGLGFSISVDSDGFTTMGHGGSVSGYNAHLVFDPKSKMGVVLLRNYSGGQTNLGRDARGLLKELVTAKIN